MIATAVGAACRLIEAWARVYTLGLDSRHRQERIDLLRSDLHDQVEDQGSEGIPAVAVAAALVGRSLRGVPADLTWRLFDARRLPSQPPALSLEGRTAMTARPIAPAFFPIAAGVVWAAVLVFAMEALPHSLAYAGGLLTLLALVAWTLEARSAPDEEVTASAWPLLVAAGIVAIAGGVVFDGGRLGLALALPLAAGLSAASARRLAPVGRGSVTFPLVAPSDLALHATRGDVIAIERSRERGVTRRALLRGGFGVALASVLAAMGGIVVDFLWQRNVAGFGAVITAGPTADFPPGTKTKVREGKFWLVNLTQEQGGPGFLALWQKCPHLGCVVPWEERFHFVDPRTGDRTEGWFRCPCHQSTYDSAGVRVYGPAPRSMDRMALHITPDGIIEVDTGDISKGSEDNASFAVRE
jgi:cytochrome b6-f complex iron-sulfur subunit